MTIKEIKQIISDSDQNNEDYIPNFQNDFEKLGYKYETINVDEDRADHSCNVQWNQTFRITKNDKPIDIYMCGTAIAEDSYGKYVSNYGYSFSIDNITISVLSKEITNEDINVETGQLATYEFYLYGENTFEHIHNEHLKGDKDIYFQHLNFRVTNDVNIAKKADETEFYQFTEKDLKRIESLDFIYNILDYTDFNSKINEIKDTLNLNYDSKKLEEFNSSFKGYVLYDNSKTDDEESISIVYYKDKEIGYLLDNRKKRDNTDYFYFKNEEILKEVLLEYFNTFDSESKEIVNFDKLIDKIDLYYFNIFEYSELFKIQTKEIDKETYDLNMNKEDIEVNEICGR